MRADNRGEGGILALLALALESARSERLRGILVLLALGGAALFYGDSRSHFFFFRSTDKGGPHRRRNADAFARTRSSAWCCIGACSHSCCCPRSHEYLV